MVPVLYQPDKALYQVFLGVHSTATKRLMSWTVLIPRRLREF